MVALFLSGITAFPIEAELNFILQHSRFLPPLLEFIRFIYDGVCFNNRYFPQIFYGCDWLAFAHVMLTILFIGVYKNPIKNIWIVEFGMIACIAVFPLAFICGTIRHIPFYWQLIDCSFGAIGIIPLLIIHRKIKQLENFN